MDYLANLKKYAAVALEIGLNLQENQILVIDADIECADFVRIVSEVAYERGARYVHLDLSDGVSECIRLKSSSLVNLSYYPSWRELSYLRMAREGAAFLSIYSPTFYNNLPEERLMMTRKANELGMHQFNSLLQSGQCPWCVISIGNNEWADKVFPEENQSNRLALLWKAIFEMCLINSENPVIAWRRSIDSINTRVDWLNKQKFSCIHFRSEGTDLHVQLPSKHRWIGSQLTTLEGNNYVPNIPSSEIFTAPYRTGVNGTVRITKPLIYDGSVISDAYLRFDRGRVIEYYAKTGMDTLRAVIKSDTGSCYVGEIALAAERNYRPDKIFYNDYYDENCSSHIALGSAYPLCLAADAEEEHGYKESQINESLTHVDFMIGNEDMDVYGTRTGSAGFVPIMRHGKWVDVM